MVAFVFVSLDCSSGAEDRNRTQSSVLQARATWIIIIIITFVSVSEMGTLETINIRAHLSHSFETLWEESLFAHHDRSSTFIYRSTICSASATFHSLHQRSLDTTSLSFWSRLGNGSSSICVLAF